MVVVRVTMVDARVVVRHGGGGDMILPPTRTCCWALSRCCYKQTVDNSKCIIILSKLDL